MPEAASEFGARLRAWRVHLHRSQAEVERRAGLAHNAVSRIENGDVVPRLGTVERIAEALDISVEQLQFKQPPPTAETDNSPSSSGEVDVLLKAIAGVPAGRRAEIIELLCQVVKQVSR